MNEGTVEWGKIYCETEAPKTFSELSAECDAYTDKELLKYLMDNMKNNALNLPAVYVCIVRLMVTKIEDEAWQEAREKKLDDYPEYGRN